MFSDPEDVSEAWRHGSAKETKEALTRRSKVISTPEHREELEHVLNRVLYTILVALASEGDSE